MKSKFQDILYAQIIKYIDNTGMWLKIFSKAIYTFYKKNISLNVLN